MNKLSKISTTAPKKLNKEEVQLETEALLKKLYDYQKLMYAQEKYSLLIILQGMDASGKDGTIQKIFTGINPLGCRVYSYKKPNSMEAGHDFLWRIHKNTPKKGMIHIYNRSHYEDILVPTVEDLFSKNIIEKRYDHINNFEELLTSDNNTRILKFYLHISPEKQKESLEERITNPQKYWKHNDGDRHSREKWDQYMSVYNKLFQHCDIVPWHIIPSDQKWYKINLITKIILKELESMDLGWPELETDLKHKVRRIVSKAQAQERKEKDAERKERKAQEKAAKKALKTEIKAKRLAKQAEKLEEAAKKIIAKKTSPNTRHQSSPTKKSPIKSVVLSSAKTMKKPAAQTPKKPAAQTPKKPAAQTPKKPAVKKSVPTAVKTPLKK